VLKIRKYRAAPIPETDEGFKALRDRQKKPRHAR
jgi:hypothetical protein